MRTCGGVISVPVYVLTCLRHLFRSRAVTNLNYFPAYTCETCSELPSNTIGCIHMSILNRLTITNICKRVNVHVSLCPRQDLVNTLCKTFQVKYIHIMVLIWDGNSKISAHVVSKIGDLVSLRHLFRSTAVTNPI